MDEDIFLDNIEVKVSSNVQLVQLDQATDVELYIIDNSIDR